MIQKMFAVRDSKANAYLQPFFSSASGSALRALGDAVADVKSPFHAHPEDYILYELGTFDDNTGEIAPLIPIKILANASDFVFDVPMKKAINGQETLGEIVYQDKFVDGKKSS